MWKDPRNCLTLPFWLHTLGVSSVIVLTHRNPLEAARSFHPWFEVSTEQALAIWERYMRTALAASRGLPVFVMPYSALLARPQHWSERLQAFLVRHGVDVSPAAGPAAASIETGLRHHALEDHALLTDPNLSPEQREIFAGLESAAGEHDRFEGWRLAPESAEVEALFAARRDKDLGLWSKLAGRGSVHRRFVSAATS